MKTILSIIFVLIASGQSYAAYSVQIDNEDGGNIFNIWFVTDEAVQVDGYQLDFFYDSSEMNYVGYTNTPPQPSGLIANLLGTPTVSQGEINNFNVASFSYDPFSASEGSKTLLGTLTFEVLDTAVANGEIDLWMQFNNTAGIVLYQSGTDVFTLFSDAPETVSYGAGLDVGTPSAVPVPAAAWLLGAGLMGLVCLRRRSAS